MDSLERGKGELEDISTERESCGNQVQLCALPLQRQSIFGFWLLLKIKKTALSPALETCILTGLHVKRAVASCNLITAASLFIGCDSFGNQIIEHQTRATTCIQNICSSHDFGPSVDLIT